jgi:hypothetical protein
MPSEAKPNDTSGEDALQPAPQKVHIRGLDDLTTKDIKLFASEYFSAYTPTNIEWIDDTSANLVYETPDIAQEALLAFAAAEISDISPIPILQTVPAKPPPLHPQTKLEVRLAVLGDRKQAGARERSRFYLFNPQYDPAERRKGAGYRGETRYRDRDDGGYRSQRYDDRENRKRRNGDAESGFDASLYDDDEAALAHRAARKKARRDSTSSGSDYRGQNSRRARFRGAAGKELFPDRVDRDSGRLRNRSASPVRGSDGFEETVESRDVGKRRRDNAASKNRESAQTIKARLRETASPKELFPHKIGVSHHRSDAFDAADTTADLFAKQMSVPFMDGSSDRHPTNDSLASRISRRPDSELGRLNIRGVAKASATQDFTIKGIAPNPGVKELFPSRGNAGKELFAERLEGRGLRRQKAEDLFYLSTVEKRR